MGAGVLITLILVCVVALCTAVLTLGRPVTRYQTVPIPMQDWALIFSPAMCALLLAILFLVPPIKRIGVYLTTDSLDLFCTVPLPSMWCSLPRPLNGIAAVQAGMYVTFLVSSAVFIKQIVFGRRYERPTNYSPKTMSTFGLVGGIAVWLLLIIGGQLFAKGGALTVAGVFGSALAVAFGLICLRGLCLWWRFREAHTNDQ